MGSVEIILKSSFYLPFSGAQFQILKPSQNLTAAGLLGWDAGELGGGSVGPDVSKEPLSFKFRGLFGALLSPS